VNVPCACGCLSQIPYPVPPEAVTLILSGGRDRYYVSDEHYLRDAEKQVYAWACGVVSAEATGWPGAYRPESAA
jgi:hypothetical protein